MVQDFLHYTITSTLEQHIASTTYLATCDDRSMRTVVLKIFHKPTFSNVSEQNIFLQESEKLTHLNHAHIVPMLEAGIHDEQAYIVSTYMPNGSLRIRLDRTYPQRLPLQQAMTIISQIGQALIYLHAHNLSHGRVKPEHILFDTNGRSLLSDIAYFIKLAPRDTDNDNTSATSRYLAPEQFVGEPSELSDQYALCCVAYELLTGRAPFKLRDPQALKEQHKYIEPTPPRQIVSQLSPTTEQALLKGLAKDPAHRHADIATFLAALQQNQKPITGPDLPLPRSKRRTTSLVPPIPTFQPDNRLPDQPTLSNPAQPIAIPKAPTQPSQLAASSSASETEDPPQIIDNANASINAIFAPLFRTTMPKSDLAIPSPSMSQDAMADPLEDQQQDIVLADDLEDQQQDTALADDLEDQQQDIVLADELLFDMNKYMGPLEIEQEEMLPMAPAVFDISDELALSSPAIQDQDKAIDIFDESRQDTALDELLQHMESEDELIFTDTASAPAGTIKQNDQDPQISFAELTASSSEPATQSDDLQAGMLAAPQAIEMFDTAPLQPQPQLTAQAPLEKSDSSRAFRSGWRTTLMSIVVILLLIGCLWTYKALAATSSTSSTLALLSNLSAPTPKATIDTLGILAPTASPASTSYHTPAAVKKTPTSTSTPTSTPILTSIPTTTSTSSPPVLDPIATPKPTAPAQPQPTTIPQPATPVGKTIWLKSAATGDYVSANTNNTSTPLLADFPQVQGWEQFLVIDAGNGHIALQALSNEDYVSAKDSTANTPLLACVTTISGWEQFTWVNLSGGNIALQASNGDYVSAWVTAKDAPLEARSTSVSTQETFSWGIAN